MLIFFAFSLCKRHAMVSISCICMCACAHFVYSFAERISHKDSKRCGGFELCKHNPVSKSTQFIWTRPSDSQSITLSVYRFIGQSYPWRHFGNSAREFWCLLPITRKTVLFESCAIPTIEWLCIVRSSLLLQLPNIPNFCQHIKLMCRICFLKFKILCP